MREFKVGDKVVCIMADDNKTQSAGWGSGSFLSNLTRGKVYTVVQVTEWMVLEMIWVCNDLDLHYSYTGARFISLREYRADIINSILI